MVRDNVLQRFPHDDLKVYVVWTPVLYEDNREAALPAASLMRDRRVSHYWDADKSLAMLFGRAVKLPRNRQLAWDVYFILDGQAQWLDGPPAIAYWMHQLGNDQRLLDGDKLAAEISKLLGAP